MNARPHQLIIGYGNRLRGDDGVGPEAADIARSWQLPGLKVVVTHQLLPELVEELKDARRVLFIDADARGGDAFTCRAVAASRSRHVLGHHQTPAHLLALLRDLEGRELDAILVTISVATFAHRDSLSEFARGNMLAALDYVRAWAEE